jgi:hypothetical protein
MGKLRRSGYIFVWWTADHSPKHVHVCRDRRLVVKWDLDNAKSMKGHASRKIIEFIKELVAEGLL